MRVVVAWVFLAAVGCNGLTGASDFRIADPGEDDGEATTGGSGQAGPSGQGAQATAGVGATTGAGGATALPEDVTDATGVSIEEIAVYQGVKVSVMKNGAASTPSAPVVAARPALVRVFTNVTTPSGGAVFGRLTIGEQTFDQPVSSMGDSQDGDLGSTINFDVPAEALTVGATFSVRILEDSATSSSPSPAAHYPADGQTDLFVKNGKVVKVKLIPVVSGGFTPDTSDAALETYRRRMYELYPTSEVVLTVGAPKSSSANLNTDQGWGSLLDQLSAERAAAGGDVDEFWYGLLRNTQSLQQFTGPYWGLANLGSPGDVYSHTGIGIGYADLDSADTFAHEIGHTHGREHSPGCDAGGPDPQYPYAQGLIGSWGYSIQSKQLLSPQQNYDMMSYCTPFWISDYVYASIHAFKVQMQGAYVFTPPDAENQEYDRYLVYRDSVEVGIPQRFAKPPMGEPHTVTITDESGATREETGRFVRWDHIDGGVLIVKRGVVPTQRIRFVTSSLKNVRTVDAAW